MKETLRRLIFTLNQIPTYGKQNLDMLLGCIKVLEKLVEESDQDG